MISAKKSGGSGEPKDMRGGGGGRISGKEQRRKRHAIESGIISIHPGKWGLLSGAERKRSPQRGDEKETSDKA